MSKKSRGSRPYIPPVRKIEVSQDNLKQRWILLAVLLTIAAVSLGFGLFHALNKEPGWQQVESISGQLHCGDDFVFQYECGSAGLSANAEYKGVTSLYTRLTEEAYSLFSAQAESESHNVHYLNAHVNETVTVEPELYEALVLLNRYGCRYHFLAPVYGAYNDVFLATTDGEAALYDPMKDPQRRAYVQELMTFVQDPGMVRLELLG